MATVVLSYIEDEDDGLQYPQKMVISRGGIEDVEQMLIFLGDAMRASGYTYVDRLGWANEEGAIKWAPF